LIWNFVCKRGIHIDVRKKPQLIVIAKIKKFKWPKVNESSVCFFLYDIYDVASLRDESLLNISLLMSSHYVILFGLVNLYGSYGISLEEI
jgi:hypothetical protein